MRIAMFVAVLLFASIATAAKAAPTLGANCGTGATIVGDNQGGRIVMGINGPSLPPYGCTITFSGPHPNMLACVAMNQTYPSPANAIVAANGSSVFITGEGSYTGTVVDGDTVTYICR